MIGGPHAAADRPLGETQAWPRTAERVGNRGGEFLHRAPIRQVVHAPVGRCRRRAQHERFGDVRDVDVVRRGAPGPMKKNSRRWIIRAICAIDWFGIAVPEDNRRTQHRAGGDPSLPSGSSTRASASALVRS